MQYQSYDVGQLSGGEIVEVTLKGNSANVKLMNSSNFSSYKTGRRHTYFGGHVTSSPYKIPIPRSGRWYVTVDLGGYSGKVSSSVKVLPGRLPQARQPSLSTVPSLVQDREIPAGFGEEPIIRPIWRASSSLLVRKLLSFVLLKRNRFLYALTGT